MENEIKRTLDALKLYEPILPKPSEKPVWLTHVINLEPCKHLHLNKQTDSGKDYKSAIAVSIPDPGDTENIGNDEIQFFYYSFNKNINKKPHSFTPPISQKQIILASVIKGFLKSKGQFGSLL